MHVLYFLEKEKVERARASRVWKSFESQRNDTFNFCIYLTLERTFAFTRGCRISLLSQWPIEKIKGHKNLDSRNTTGHKEIN